MKNWIAIAGACGSASFHQRQHAATCLSLAQCTGTGRMARRRNKKHGQDRKESHTQLHMHARTPRQKQRFGVRECNCNLGCCRFYFSITVYSKAYVASLIVPFPLSSSSLSRPRTAPGRRLWSQCSVVFLQWQMEGAVVGGRWERHCTSLLSVSSSVVYIRASPTLIKQIV